MTINSHVVCYQRHMLYYGCSIKINRLRSVPAGLRHYEYDCPMTDVRVLSAHSLRNVRGTTTTKPQLTHRNFTRARHTATYIIPGVRRKQPIGVISLNTPAYTGNNIN